MGWYLNGNPVDGLPSGSLMRIGGSGRGPWVQGTLRTHFPELDGLRGLAVLMVVGYHFGVPHLRGGSIGVDVFFVLSGFVVTRSILRGPFNRGWVRTFLSRRFWRLAPAVAVLLIGASLWFVSDGGFSRLETAALLGGITNSYNLLAALNRVDFRIVHLWSLAVEWQYYVMIPIAFRFGHSGRKFLLAFGILGSIGLRCALLLSGTATAAEVYFLTPTRLDGLLLGSLLALITTRALSRIPRFAGPFGLISIMILPVALPAWTTSSQLGLLFGVPAAAFATALVVARAASCHSTPMSFRPLASPIMRWFGERSYSIYLWHYPIGVTIIGGDESFQGMKTFAAQVLFSCVAGDLSYRSIEGPLRRYGASRRRPQRARSWVAGRRNLFSHTLRMSVR
jgi:peptidoglycan/LPS O-acetylase OafA/YrhL